MGPAEDAAQGGLMWTACGPPLPTEAFPQFSVLLSVVMPPVGGDTVWANTVAAYETLPPLICGLTDQLWALHSNSFDYAHPNATAQQVHYRETVFKSTIYKTEHPWCRCIR